MPRQPSFWRHNGTLARVLSPLAALTVAATASRVARPGWRAPVPVFCCGNVTVGGAGKTTVALSLGARLIAAGRAVHFLTRGYGGAVRGPHRVEAGDTADQVGDEPLLLAEIAPTWVGADRAASARAAIAAGARVLVMDDGLQNPDLQKDLSLLVVDGAFGFGNGRVLPAGPLREPVEVAARRCQAAILIGPDETGIAADLRLPILAARLSPCSGIQAWAGRRAFAFAGIARPEKFFRMLAEAGIIVAGARPLPDHYRFNRRFLDRLLADAARLDATPLTTPKDAARLPAAYRDQIGVVGVSLAWDNPAALDALVAQYG